MGFLRQLLHPNAAGFALKLNLHHSVRYYNTNITKPHANARHKGLNGTGGGAAVCANLRETDANELNDLALFILTDCLPLRSHIR